MLSRWQHISTIENYIKTDFEGKSAFRVTQYLRGHLFVFIDSVMGLTYESSDLQDEKTVPGTHPFDFSLVQRLFRSFLRLAVAYFRKLLTMGKAIQESASQPRLFLVDP